MITGLVRAIFKAGFILIIPVAGLIGLIVFFGSFLTPAQRGMIFKEMLASIPGARDFVSVQHKTSINLTANERANKLKTAFQSFDYLISIKNKKGEEYIAIYPFTVEAGYELDQLKIEKTGQGEKKKVEITLPPAVILNINEQSDIMILRNRLEGDRDLILKPAKIAFEKAARDRALRMGILDEADKRAKEYYQNFWKGVYDEIIVHFTKPSVDHFTEYSLPHLPVKFEVSKEKFPYDFHPSEDYRCNDGFLSDAEDDYIYLGYSKEYRELHRDLYDKIASSLGDDGYALKFVDTDDPKNKAAVCEYNSRRGVCFSRLGSKLFYIYHKGRGQEQIRTSLGDVFYLSFSARDGSNHDPKYYQYVEYLKDAKVALKEDKNYAKLLNISRSLIDISNGSRESKRLFSIARALQESKFDETGDDSLDLLLSLLSTVKSGNISKIDREKIEKARNQFMTNYNKELLNTFRSYLLSNLDLNKSDEERMEDISGMLQDGYFSSELFDAITIIEYKKLLKMKLDKMIKDIIDIRGKEKGHAVYCDANFKYDCHESYVYYDPDSLDKVYKHGSETVRNKLAGPEFNPDDHLIIVVGRGYFFYNFDAFIFTKEGIWLLQDFIHKRNPKFYKYTELNMGGKGNEVTLDGQKYQNYILTTFLDEISKIIKNRTKGGSSQKLVSLIEEQVAKEVDVMYVHQP